MICIHPGCKKKVNKKYFAYCTRHDYERFITFCIRRVADHNINFPHDIKNPNKCLME